MESFPNPRTCIPVKVYSTSKHELPEYAHWMDSGMDLRANLPEESPTLIVDPLTTVIVPTGLYVAIPPGYELQVRPRSGISFKTGIRIANSPGTIDAPYRGEIGVILNNLGNSSYPIKDGEKIAQLVLVPVLHCNWERCTSIEDLGDTTRAEGGFGSTGS